MNITDKLARLLGQATPMLKSFHASNTDALAAAAQNALAEYSIARIEQLKAERDAEVTAYTEENVADDLRAAWRELNPDDADELDALLACQRALLAQPEARGVEGMVDDRLSLSDVAGVLGEIAEQFDGGEYSVSEEARRVLIDFANGLPDHPLFIAVGHYFAQNPVPFAAAPAAPGVRVEGQLHRTLYDQRDNVHKAAEKAGPKLYVALKNLLEAIEERRDQCGIESITISDAHNALAAALAPDGGEGE